MIQLNSEMDESVNFITPHSDGGYFESRYVRRTDDYFSCYLSSQTGCNRGCQFCHLTTTKQTMFTHATPADYMEQWRNVLQHYLTKKPAREVNFNWMARGEALCNPNIVKSTYFCRQIFDDLTTSCLHNNLIPKFNISTIMPKTLDTPLEEIFVGVYPTIYYSPYSMNPNFRERWLPGAMEPKKALEMLAEYQRVTHKIIKLHWAFIVGDDTNNINLPDLRDISCAVNYYNLMVDINLVRYNAPNINSQEAEDYERAASYLKTNIRKCKDVRIIQRVGIDVMASCGTFYKE